MTTQVQPLPAGRHGLPASFVRADQRRRLIDATGHVVSEHGYDGCTVDRIIAHARVSRKTFYEFFSGRADAVEAAIDADGIVSMQTGIAELDRSGWRLVREVVE